MDRTFFSWLKSPAGARFGPFLVILILTSLQGQFGEASRYWLYLAKIILGALGIWLIRPYIPEMRWKIGWEGLAAGVIVYLLWTQLDPLYPKFGSEAKPWNPFSLFPKELAWMFVFVRIAGSALIIPPLEEVFYRSFLYRYITRKDFLALPLNRFVPRSFILTTLIFGFAHHEWLAAILCAAIYHGLILRHNRMGDAICAHAVTNLLLGLHVVSRGAWQFW